MSAQYYYLEADGQSVRGPFGLQDIWALLDKQVLSSESLIAREGSSDWQALHLVPELQAHAEEAESRPEPRSTGEIVTMAVLTLLMPIIGVVFGLVELTVPARRGVGAAFIGFSILLIFVYYALFMNP